MPSSTAKPATYEGDQRWGSSNVFGPQGAATAATISKPSNTGPPTRLDPACHENIRISSEAAISNVSERKKTQPTTTRPNVAVRRADVGRRSQDPRPA